MMAIFVVSVLPTLDLPSNNRRFAAAVPHLARLPEQFSEREDFLAAVLVLINIAVVIGSGIAAYKLNTWWGYLVAFILVGARAQALNILQHEAMHYLLFTNRGTNIFIGSVLSGLIGTRYFDGRNLHMKHHRNIGLPDDPNEYFHGTKGREPVLKAASFFASQLFGVRVFMLFARLNMLVFQIVTGQKKAPRPATPGVQAAPVPAAPPAPATAKDTPFNVMIDLACLGVTQLTVFAFTWYFSAFWVYPLLYVTPIVTLAAFFEAVRTFSEHVLPGEAGSYAEEHRLFLMHASAVERFFISQFSFHYHHLHHLYPNVPTFKMKEVHEWLCHNDPYYRLRYIDRDGFLKTAINYVLGKTIAGSGAISLENAK